MAHSDTYVIIPVYNEAKVLGGVIETLQPTFSNIVCVDDGSSDNSAAVAEKAGAVLVQHPVNLGAGGATQTGVEYALLNPDIEYFVTFDADGQHHVEDAIKMLEYIEKNKVDIVFGSRFLHESEVKNMSAPKRALLKLAKVFSRFDTGINLTDPHIGLRVFNRKFAENLKLTMSDFSHASELVSRVKDGGYRYAELPVTVTYTDYTKAKGQPMLNSVNILFDLILHRFTKK